MKLAIPRGIIYHGLGQELAWLTKALVAKLNDRAKVEEFEEQFAALIGRKHCIAFPFARTAIYYALMRRNFPQGSEILMPPISIKGILDVVLALGLKPVFVDIDENTLGFDQELLIKSITSNTKAAIVTYLFGIVPDVEKLVAICREHDIFVIEDFSQCLNGKFNGKKIGNFGDVGVYSSSSIKTLDTYGGGLLVCDDDTLKNDLKANQATLHPPVRKQLIQKIITDLIRNIATTRIVFHFVVFPLLRLINSLRPDSVLKHTGDRAKEMSSQMPSEWFCSYTSFQADVGLKIIETLESEDQSRLSNVAKIKSSASLTAFPKGAAGGENIYWQLVAYFDKPSDTQKHWHRQGIDTSTTSLLKISDLPAYPYRETTPNADKLYSNGLFIPCYPGLNESDMARIIHVLNVV